MLTLKFVINFLLFYFCYGKIVQKRQIPKMNEKNSMTKLDDIFIDPYVVLRLIPDSIGSENQNVTLASILRNIPASQSIDQVVKLTEWFTPTFSHYQVSFSALGR